LIFHTAGSALTLLTIPPTHCHHQPVFLVQELEISMQTSLVIRCATSGDVALIERFITDIANFHGDTYTDNRISTMRDLFGPTSSARAYFGETTTSQLLLQFAIMNMR
jgi:hypothetical protein